MIDTTNLSLSHACFSLTNGRQRRRELVDIFSTIAWSWDVAMRADVEPLVDLVKWHAGDSMEPARLKYAHRQWSERFQGRRSPSPKLIAEMEARSPGSAATWSLALWPALRADMPLGEYIDAVVQRLPERKYRAFTKLLLRSLRFPGRVVHPYLQPVIDMTLSASLDDLACLLVLLRLTIERGKGRETPMAENLFVVMLVQAPWLADHGLLAPIAEYVDKHFFKRVNIAWLSHINSQDYLYAAHQVAETLAVTHPETPGYAAYETWKPAVLASGYAWELVDARRRIAENKAKRRRCVNNTTKG
ncbi:hypothetical protein [Paucibacter sp. DJ2R-2]|uniref:hypothetical protein n=1 Tax=Paucibacter sp. DJ2R-2 TaxID=2893558 RepID=UPI0021E42477|nr:hypothetical protein [Paucibacter sp. DJ2R-2]MCV2437192.1 hypothetical protein [Paucibacter sp. DJ2R-2]